MKQGQEFSPFTVVDKIATYRGPYNRGPARTFHFKDWVCQICGYSISASGLFNAHPRMERHEQLGHSPCEQCGAMLRNREDGSPRRHNWRLCPGKDESYRVVSVYERETAVAA